MGESLLIPYLLSLGVSNTVANFAWLINPVFGLFLQPVLGHASDSCTSAMGRRRPFLFLFHLGSVCGLLTVVFAADVLHLLGYPAYSEGGASTVLVGLIFLGFATADMCHDLMLMPARALLNDQLPDEQIDQGNSSFALISSLGAIIGLSMVIAPLDDLWPLSLLFIPIRATFVVAAALVMTSNVISFFIARNIDTPLSEIKLRQAKEEEEARAAQRAKLDPHSPHSGAGHPERTAEPAASPSPPPAPKGGEGELLTLSSILFVYSVVPRPLVVIWLCQFFFWSLTHTHHTHRSHTATPLTATHPPVLCLILPSLLPSIVLGAYAFCVLLWVSLRRAGIACCTSTSGPLRMWPSVCIMRRRARSSITGCARRRLVCSSRPSSPSSPLR